MWVFMLSFFKITCSFNILKIKKFLMLTLVICDWEDYRWFSISCPHLLPLGVSKNLAIKQDIFIIETKTNKCSSVDIKT